MPLANQACLLAPPGSSKSASTATAIQPAYVLSVCLRCLAALCRPAENAKGVVILVHGHGSYIVFEYLQRQVCVTSSTSASSRSQLGQVASLKMSSSAELQAAACNLPALHWVRCQTDRPSASVCLHATTKLPAMPAMHAMHKFVYSTALNPLLLLLLLLLQGVGNWKTYEGSWVQALNAAGFSVAGIDNRGCGRSSGLLGYVVSFEFCWQQLWLQQVAQAVQLQVDVGATSVLNC
jgi:hypothetical protein